MLFIMAKLYATDGYVKVTSADKTISWVKIKLEYKYNGNQYKVSSNSIDTMTEGDLDLDNVWSESGGTGEQYIIIELDYSAFYGCSKITSVKCSSNSFVSIYGQAFQGCSSLKSVYIPYAQSLGNSAFAYCSSLTSVTLNNIYRIDDSAFYGCTALTSFNIPAKVRIIEGNAFQFCTSLTNLTISSSNTYFTIENGVIYSKDLTTLQLYLPSKTETCFYVPSTVISIGNDAFCGNRNLSTVIIRNGVQTIGSSAFNNTNIQSVYLPGSITTIGNFAFYNSNKLNSVKTASSVPITITNNVFSNAGKATLYVPQGSKDAYEDAENWKVFSLIEEYSNGNIITFSNSTVKDICVSNWDLNGDGELDENEAKEVEELGTQFQNNTEITSFDELQYFTNLQTIAASSFSGCTNLSSVKVPSSVTNIGHNAFYNTAWLNSQPDGLLYIGRVLYAYRGTMPQNTKIIVKDGTTSICDYAFNNQIGLIDIELPNSLVSIGSELEGYVFSGCTGLTAIKIPEGVKSIVRYTFSSSGLKTIELPEGLLSIGNSSFRSCSNLESIVIPFRVTSIGKNSFRSCSKLKSVTMPYYLKTVATDAFRDCSQLQAVYISNLENWIQISFEDYRANPLSYAHHLYLNNEEIIDLVIPMASSYGYSGSEIHYYPSTINPLVFYGCNSFKTVSIPKSISSIGNDAFYGCTALTAVKVESAPFELSSYAFPTRSNVTLYTSQFNLSQYQAANVWNTFKALKSYPNVDVNCDENVDVVDVVDIVRYTKGNPSDSFDKFLADINSDKEIDLNDAKQDLNAVSYSTTLTTILPESGGQANTIKIGNFEVRSRKTCVASIILKNTSDKLVGFQMDVALPEGLSLSSNLCRLSKRITDEEQQLIVSYLGNDTYRFTSVSLSLQPISGNDGELITLSLDATNLTSRGNITVSNIRFVTDNSERIVMPNAEFEVQPVEYLQFPGGDGTENNPYLILDPMDFINLANDVNGGTNYEGVFFKVAKSEIDFDGVNYSAIGTGSKQFAGNFNGNDVVIKKLTISDYPSYSGKGLFGYVGEKGSINSITMDETCSIYGSYDVGGIVGANKGSISSCINKAIITGSACRIGGICGDNMGVISDCSNYGDVQLINNNDAVGMMGGIAGDCDEGTISNCNNYGNITALGNGGIWAFGGIVGLLTNGEQKGLCTIENSTNMGDVYGRSNVGGIVGAGNDLGHIIRNCMVSDCTIQGRETSVGAIFSSCSTKNFSNNYYSTNVIVIEGNKTYDGFSARGTCYNKRGDNITENDGAILRYSLDNYLNLNEGGFFEITSVNDLKIVASLVSEGGFDLEGTAFKVTTKELDLEKGPIIIGQYCTHDESNNYQPTYKPFSGVFDGNGVVIKNLQIENNSDYYSSFSLFAYNKGIVKNIILDESCSINANNSGGIVAINEGTISGCINKGVYNYGGIAYSNSGTICNNFVIGNNPTKRISGAIVYTNNGKLENNLYRYDEYDYEVTGTSKGDISNNYGAIRAFTISPYDNKIEIVNKPTTGLGIIIYDETTYYASGLTVNLYLNYTDEILEGYEATYNYNGYLTPNEDGTYPITIDNRDVLISCNVQPRLYKLTYYVDGEEYYSQDYYYNYIVYSIAEPTKKGYTFSGWINLPEKMPAYDVKVTGTFSINTGDANGDNVVDMIDVVAMINYIIGKPSNDFNTLAADLNGDSEVDVFDVMLAINFVLNNKNAVRSISRAVSDLDEMAIVTATPDGILLGINNSDRFTAFQFDVEVTDGMELTDARLNDNAGNHKLYYFKNGQNTYRVIGVSMDNSTLTTNGTDLVELLFSKSGNVRISDIVFVTPQETKVHFVGSDMIVTDIEGIEYEQTEEIFDLSGRKVDIERNQLPKGIYIINNRKVVIK